ncbi:O-antigen ligase family protein [Vibrio alginolyticus]|uniref:O-antigen ligase family protein n=1 Tax=Vibrio sp. B1FLJ16 TaxID=2751178 RepID=UPI0015F42391|nr:O-antigen ligase family protein [Vibrio sp. B1FLJ16]
MILKPSINEKLSFLYFLPLTWAVTGMLLYRDGHKLMVLFALIVMLVSFSQYGLQLALSNIKAHRLLQLLLVTLGFYIAVDVYQGYGSSVIRAFSVVVVILTFTPAHIWRKQQKHVPIWVLVGALTCFVSTFYQAHILQLGRWWNINPIPYTTVACVFSLLSAMLLVLKASSRTKVIAFASFMLSFNALILGEARGVLLAFYVAVFAFFFVIKFSNHVLIGKYVLILGIAMATLIFMNKQTIENRIEQTNKEAATIAGGNLDSSIGLRLQMWKSGLEMFKKAPVLGYGDGHLEQKEMQYEEGIISKNAISFTHYHSQFIEALVKTGIIGFLVILALLLLPFYYHYQTNNLATLAASVISLAYIVASLTDVPMSHAQTIIVYFLFIKALLSNLESDNCLGNAQ